MSEEWDQYERMFKAQLSNNEYLLWTGEPRKNGRLQRADLPALIAGLSGLIIIAALVLSDTFLFIIAVLKSQTLTIMIYAVMAQILLFFYM